MKIKISAHQLFSSIILVPLGSALLFFLAPEAKQDVWLAVLIYIFPAIILQVIYTSLWNKYPQDSIVTYMPKIFGKFIGNILSVIYIIYFAYISARILRDFQELMLVAIMPKMPPIIISIMITSVIGYGVYLGLENMCRAAHILLYLWIFYFIMEWLILFITPDALQIHNLKPVLENGIVFVIKKSWKIITFPYGETILFTMFFPYTVEVSKVRKASVLAIIAEGIFISLNTVIFIATLGVEYASTSLFPLLQTLRIMRIGEAFDRVDVFVIFIIVLVGFVKASFFLYGAMLGTAQLIKLKDTKYLAIPFSIILLITSQLIAKNFPQHIYIGQVFTLKYIHLPVAIIIPIIALLVYHIRNLGKKNSPTSEQQN
ncbi:GerAB/ArcD/ProY family transporter [Clostridium sp. DJ247]|uniref:GerAB/ArcD/ProY family transporter n=1 Tax=Clostridium sp. DJ247 TaxID=2726188 RepID=UPI001623C0A9|nr:GerAB/ArcD/ProY family transporter [Clostridium sp. DJ247]MBC2580192.1 GerAB/ArcD/ProY family transporter [Clostridium sp. DJ247]